MACRALRTRELSSRYDSATIVRQNICHIEVIESSSNDGCCSAIDMGCTIYTIRTCSSLRFLFHNTELRTQVQYKHKAIYTTVPPLSTMPSSAEVPASGTPRLYHVSAMLTRAQSSLHHALQATCNRGDEGNPMDGLEVHPGWRGSQADYYRSQRCHCSRNALLHLWL